MILVAGSKERYQGLDQIRDLVMESEQPYHPQQPQLTNNGITNGLALRNWRETRKRAKRIVSLTSRAPR